MSLSPRTPAAALRGLALLGVLAGAGLAGCTPNIGDSCSLSTDCASDGTRVCDTSEPGGYCTIINCTGSPLGSACPGGSYCVDFGASVPGCPFTNRVPAPAAQSFCMEGCNSDSDCRGGYLCRSPSGQPWGALILDPTTNAKVCMAALWFVDGGISHENLGYTGSLDAIPPVCQTTGPSFDAGWAPLDAGSDAAKDAGKKDSGKEGGASEGGAKDGGKKDGAGDAKGDGTVRDAAPDARPDAQPDAGPPDGSMKDGAPDAAPDAGPG